MANRAIYVEALGWPAVEEEPLEVVERKGRGHPDTICDGVAEQVALALGQEYVRLFGRVAHFNVDKALLIAGRTRPRFGGGVVEEPMRLILGGRATERVGPTTVPVRELACQAARAWLRANLRYVQPDRDLVLESAIKPGSEALSEVYRTGPAVANDTSVAVGYAPLSGAERLVLATEGYVNSPQFKAAHPEAGSDVKVLAIRRGRQLHATVALAFVDRFVESEAAYFRLKAAIAAELAAYLSRQAQPMGLALDALDLNTLDRRGRGEAGLYLTVLGTSAEAGDDGEVGRGNQTNGLIALNRPRGAEAAPGKNPVNHVGKVYSVLAGVLARAIHDQVPGVREASVRLVSQIGAPVDRPLVAWVRVVLAPGAVLAPLEGPIAAIVDAGLADVGSLSQRLLRGECSVW